MKITSLNKMSGKQLEMFGRINAPIIKKTLEDAMEKNRVRGRVKCSALYNGHINVEIEGFRENTRNTNRYFSLKTTIVGTKLMNFIYIRPEARVPTYPQTSTAPGKRDKLISVSRAIGAFDNLGFHNMQVAVDALEEAKSISYFEQELMRVLDTFHVAVKSLFNNADWNA